MRNNNQKISSYNKIKINQLNVLKDVGESLIVKLYKHMRRLVKLYLCLKENNLILKQKESLRNSKYLYLYIQANLVKQAKQK